MINIKDLINNLNKATVLEVKRDKNSFIIVSIHMPTNDLDDIYSVYNSGGGFILHWEGMEMITKDICLLKEDFSLLYIEVLKELMKREGHKLVPVDKLMDCLSEISDRSYIDDNVSEIKAMIEVVE